MATITVYALQVKLKWISCSRTVAIYMQMKTEAVIGHDQNTYIYEKQVA